MGGLIKLKHPCSISNLGLDCQGKSLVKGDWVRVSDNGIHLGRVLTRGAAFVFQPLRVFGVSVRLFYGLNCECVRGVYRVVGRLGGGGREIK